MDSDLASKGKDSMPICALCGRPIPPDVAQSRHHLVPKLRGGKGGQTVLLHQICHNQIHLELSEAELAHSFNTVASLRSHPALARFITWVGKRPPDFYAVTKGARRRRGRH
ncbi:HNH endonuclease [Aliiroseovarius sp. Z3]|uniref:HNH endonuclease n=1 Tax=Aliiroseovarius sp. Z3 TaxID=2811402 RepID=UPI0023B2D9EA|nr:HNH endonuclease [Aliiroseovarius sp. Z3]MDE9450247.1 HNH endonuclease [Aliiroseovarius sp. Z3]